MCRFLCRPQLTNHGVSKKLMSNVLEVAEEFFELPVEDKASIYSEDPKRSCRLYTSIDYDKEKVHFWRDCDTLVIPWTNTFNAGPRSLLVIGILSLAFLCIREIHTSRSSSKTEFIDSRRTQQNLLLRQTLGKTLSMSTNTQFSTCTYQFCSAHLFLASFHHWTQLRPVIRTGHGGSTQFESNVIDETDNKVQ